MASNLTFGGLPEREGDLTSGQKSQLQLLKEKGIVTGGGDLNTENLSRSQLFDYVTGGFGLGDNDLHRKLRSQADAAFSASKGQRSGGMLTFGGLPTQQAAPAPTPAPAPVTATADSGNAQMNQNFVDFLDALGLQSLFNLFSGGQTQTGYTPSMFTPERVDFSQLLIPKSTVGYDPVRGTYSVPSVMNPESAAGQAGLFNYIYAPYTQPMAPANPMEGITVPFIPYQGS